MLEQPRLQSKFCVGLTGGISCGKTTISNIFQDLNINVIDADLISREVVANGSKTLNILENHFGKQIINKDGSLNRSLLRKLVFADKKELKYLNNVMHPAINQALKDKIKAATSVYIILAIPLLFENHLEHLVDRILVANASLDCQIKRTMERDQCDYATALSIIKAQVSEEYRCTHADDLIQTDTCSIEQIKDQVLKLHLTYMRLAQHNQEN